MRSRQPGSGGGGTRTGLALFVVAAVSSASSSPPSRRRMPHARHAHRATPPGGKGACQASAGCGMHAAARGRLARAFASRRRRAVGVTGVRHAAAAWRRGGRRRYGGDYKERQPCARAAAAAAGLS